MHSLAESQVTLGLKTVRKSKMGPVPTAYTWSHFQTRYFSVLRISMTTVLRIKTLCIARAERDGTRAETRFRLSPKRTSPFRSAGASVQSTSGSRGVRISGSNAG